MRYAILDGDYVIVNTIEVAPEHAAQFHAHYLGDSNLGIGDTYPAVDLAPPTEPQLLGQQITDEQLARIELGQRQTDIELSILGGTQHV